HTDHQGLQYFQTKQRLNARQARWQQDLAEFDFIIKYKPAVSMGKPDALSRKAGSAKEGIEAQFFSTGTILPNADEGLSPRITQILALENEINDEPDNINAPDPEIGIDVANWRRTDMGL